MVCQGRPDLALVSYQKAAEIEQEGYDNLKHLVYWEEVRRLSIFVPSYPYAFSRVLLAWELVRVSSIGRRTGVVH